jgi:hypothetical protein
VIRIVILWLLCLLTARPLEFHVTLLGKLGAAMLFISLIVLLATPRSLAWPPLIFWAAAATALSDIWLQVLLARHLRAQARPEASGRRR